MSISSSIRGEHDTVRTPRWQGVSGFHLETHRVSIPERMKERKTIHGKAVTGMTLGE
ncbi:MAG: hypothetical protein MI923_02430 [Phycisphaerales bacterium]|nr:hypothetical protein [Phycisphaerales bacterium]